MSQTARAIRQTPNTTLLSPSAPYLVPPEPLPTGDDFVDRGTGCDPADPAHANVWQHYVHDHCFLVPSQRAGMIEKYRGRVLAAATYYSDALTDLRVDELLKPDPQSGMWIFELLLDVVGLMAVSGVMHAFAAARAGASPTLATLSAGAEEAAAELEKTSEKQLESMLKQATTTGKKSVPKPSPANDEKSERIAYLEALRDTSAVRFQALREQGAAGATDAQLIVLVDAFDAQYHSVGAYKRELASKLERFQASGLGRMGVGINQEYDPTPFGNALQHHQEVETKAFWVQLPTGKRLALYRRGHTHVPAVGEQRCLLGTGCYSTPKWEADVLAERDGADNPFRFERFVPDEFVATALGMHTARWQSPPDEHQSGAMELMSNQWVTP